MLVEAFGPKVIAGFSVDQLYVYPKPVAAALHRTLKHIADVQLASQLLYVHSFSLEREGRVARNYERAVDARQVCGQALGDTVHEVLLLGIAADVCKGQNHDGQVGSRR